MTTNDTMSASRAETGPPQKLRFVELFTEYFFSSHILSMTTRATQRIQKRGWPIQSLLLFMEYQEFTSG